MPATGNFILSKGYDAAVALTKFRAVKFSAEETVTPVTGIADMVIGVAQFGVTTAEILKGKGASVAVEGITEMEASLAIAVGAEVGIATDGRAAAMGVGVRSVGVCTKGCAAAGERISVKLNLPGRVQ